MVASDVITAVLTLVEDYLQLDIVLVAMLFVSLLFAKTAMN
jgi:hypothetical protein